MVAGRGELLPSFWALNVAHINLLKSQQTRHRRSVAMRFAWRGGDLVDMSRIWVFGLYGRS